MNIEDNEDDILISSLIAASKVYLKNAGVKEDLSNEGYRLVIKLMTAQHYENRIENNSGKNPSYCLSLQSLITQLAYSGGSNESN